jgi:peptidoglycan/LPS O-acetylase OafA/YrhL
MDVTEIPPPAAGPNADVAIPATPATAGSADTRLAYIDSLRAIAAMLVLWTHASESFYRIGSNALQSRWIYDWQASINAGRIGVVAFFAISGFVVPFSIKLTHRYPVREFLLKRFFRIFPAYWLSIPFGVLTTYWLWNRHFSVSELLVNLTMLEYVFDVRPAIGLYWTLAVEFVFYVCCALLVLTHSIDNYRRIGLLVVVLILAHVGAVVSSHFGWMAFDYLKSQWFLNLGVMFWGTLYRANMLRAGLDPIAKACLWGAFVFLIVLYPVVFKLMGIPYPTTASYSAGILLFVLGTTVLRISIWPFPMLGAISYSIYLFHPVVFNPMLRALGLLPAD